MRCAAARRIRRGSRTRRCSSRRRSPPTRCLPTCSPRSCDRAFIGDDPLPRTERAFAEQVKRARTRLPAVAEGAFRLLAAIAAEHHALSQRLAALPPSQARLAADVRGAARCAGLPGILFGHALDAARPSAALSAGARAATRQMPRTIRPRRQTRASGRRALGALSGARRRPTGPRSASSRRSRRFAGCSRN